ncbi:MAG TPA: acyl-ACP--UDP-N-acetylglucosamine O-acyltransferase [Chthoniobacteraceae bacterium]|nr:acyl-ACP--UDP-N-acetylglucosamine O-acyltransferase [Chthoniobacteraceae bacterium]
MIHPTAIIDPQARLGENVTVGAYAVIEGPAEVGDGCTIQAHAILSGRVVLGPENFIGYGSVIGGYPQDLGFNPETKSEVRLGARNRIREHCTIHRASKEGGATTVGDDCYLMAGAHLGHDVQLGHRIVIANNALLGGHVQVADHVFIGGGSVFHQHMRVGRLVITQGKSGFSKDIPPYTIGAEVNLIAGLNVVGMRRAGFSSDQRREVKKAFALLYQSGLNVRQALTAAAEQEWGPEAQAFFEFVSGAGKRGVCALMQTGGATGEGDGS